MNINFTMLIPLHNPLDGYLQCRSWILGDTPKWSVYTTERGIYGRGGRKWGGNPRPTNRRPTRPRGETDERLDQDMRKGWRAGRDEMSWRNGGEKRPTRRSSVSSLGPRSSRLTSVSSCRSLITSVPSTHYDLREPSLKGEVNDGSELLTPPAAPKAGTLYHNN